MKLRYLKYMEVNWSDKGLLPDPDDLTVGSEDRLKNKELAWRISIPISRLQLVGAFFHYNLRDTRPPMARPPASRVLVYLSRDPEPGVKFVRGDLYVEIAEDPLKLLELANGAAEMGEFALSCWERAFPKLETESDFPIGLVRQLMDRFRSQGYSQSNSLPLQQIVGSKAKARIRGTVSCARTEVKLEVIYRGEPILERTIWDVPEQAFNVAYMKRDVLVENGKLTVCAAPLGLAPEASFALESLPDDFLKTIA